MWCPKCKTEFREGILNCVDCGTQLVEELDEEMELSNICSVKDEQMAEKFLEFLEYSKISGANKKFNKENEVYTIAVPKSSEKEAEKLFHGFLTVISEEEEAAKEEEEKSETAIEPEGEDIISEAESGDDPEVVLETTTKTYVKKEEEYKDLKFSALTFILFGIGGLVYLALCKTGVLPITYNTFIFVVIVVMFVAFIIVGIYSIIKAGKVKELIPQEQETTRSIKEWLAINVTENVIESWKDSKVSEAENDLLIMAQIRTALQKNFTEAEAGYLEMLSEEYFDDHFGEKIEE